jgi:hypothetical protein
MSFSAVAAMGKSDSTRPRPALFIRHVVASRVLSQQLDRPLPTKDGGTLRTVLDARTYMLELSEDRGLRAQWQRACELILQEADVAEVSRQLELALFYDGRLVLT